MIILSVTGEKRGLLLENAVVLTEMGLAAWATAGPVLLSRKQLSSEHAVHRRNLKDSPAFSIGRNPAVSDTSSTPS